MNGTKSNDITGAAGAELLRRINHVLLCDVLPAVEAIQALTGEEWEGGAEADRARISLGWIADRLRIEVATLADSVDREAMAL